MIPPEVRACIGGITSGRRALSGRMHRLILHARRGVQVSLSCKFPACQAGKCRRYGGAGKHGVSACGWQRDRDAASPEESQAPAS